MKKLLKSWLQISKWSKIAIIAIPIAIIIFTITCINTDWGEFVTTEDDYLALERVAYDIIDNKNVMQPLSESLEHYSVNFKEDGSIEIKLYGYAESIVLELSKDFEIKSFNRADSFVVPTIIAAVLASFVIGYICSALIYIIAIIIKRIYLYFK